MNAQFPILNSYTYLNTANSGMISQAVLDWRREHDTDFLNNGSVFRNHQLPMLNDLKSTLARFFHAKQENIYLVPNFSFGLNVFLDGLSGEQRFLLLEGDYPTSGHSVRSRGFDIAYSAIDEHLEINILEQVKTFKPTVFVLSIVQYTSGIKISLDFLKELKSTYPDLLIVADGMQFCGTEHFDFEQSGLDALICGGYKWLLAGYGNGFICMKDKVKEQLYTEARTRPLPAEGFTKHRNHISYCFEAGNVDTLAFGSLYQALLWLEELGHEFISSRIIQLSRKAKQAFTDRGLLEQAVVLRKEDSPIFNLLLDETVYEKLLASNIICSLKGKGIRVSFHFFNTEEDIDLLLKVIDHSRALAGADVSLPV
jgi:selenocysteine lyase/cysteine desulfurase